MRKLLLGTAAAIGLAISAGTPAPAKANVIFGNVNPSPGCNPTAIDPGHVCSITETFTSGSETIVANGFSGAPAPGTGNANLTLRGGPLAPAVLLPTNPLDESGLGVNANAGPGCTDPTCEISPPASVTAVDPRSAITDALVASVQPGETFNFFVETTPGGAFNLLNTAGPIDGSTCVGPGFSVGPVADTCLWNAPPGQTRAGVAVQAVSGDETLAEVSTISEAVPEPASLALLGTALLGFGVTRRRVRSYWLKSDI